MEHLYRGLDNYSIIARIKAAVTNINQKTFLIPHCDVPSGFSPGK